MKISKTDKFKLLNNNITIGKTSKSVGTLKTIKVTKKAKESITTKLGGVRIHRTKTTGCKGCSRKRGK